MAKNYTDNNEKLNYDINFPVLIFNDSVEILNFKMKQPGLNFNEVTPGLNFKVNDYGGAWIIYKILMDFIENYSVGDVFTVSSALDTAVVFANNILSGTVPKRYSEEGEDLLFTIISTMLIFTGLTENLNFNILQQKMIYSGTPSTCLNFIINDYDGVYMVYGGFVDWIENYYLGDVF